MPPRATRMFEAFLLGPREQVAFELKCTVVAGARGVPRGSKVTLRFTNLRFCLEDKYGVLRVNVPLDRVSRVTASVKGPGFASRISFLSRRTLTIAYEDWYGVAQKVTVSVGREDPEAIASQAEALMVAARRTGEPILPKGDLELFREFVHYLFAEKGIAPLKYDTVSRGVEVEGRVFYVAEGWQVIGDPGIKEAASRWLEEFLSSKGLKPAVGEVKVEEVREVLKP